MNPILARCIVSPIQGRDRPCSLEGSSERYEISFNAAHDAKAERVSADRVDGRCGDYVRGAWADADKKIGRRAIFYKYRESAGESREAPQGYRNLPSIKFL